MCLMNKAIDFAKRNRPLAILSVTASETAEGFIYVEAYKEINVREAIKNLSNILQGKILLVPPEEMSVVYQSDKAQKSNIEKYQWVRVQ